MPKQKHLDQDQVLDLATKHLAELKGSVFDFIEIARPPDVEYAQHQMLILSKLSPIMGNMLEFDIVKRLNRYDWRGAGQWKRQDPGFPDAIFIGNLNPCPGVEIKSWFPLATEMTARFKESILHFEQKQTNVAVVAWLPEHVIYGKPKILDVWVGSGESLASARDKHYHDPPDYLVFEPGDTTARTSNLQQTNTNGYKFQGTRRQLQQAEQEVAAWGPSGKTYKATTAYQTKLKSLMSRYSYRLDTNFAKIDRIEHEDLEQFKESVLNTKIESHTVREWTKLLFGEDEEVRKLLSTII